MEASEADAGRPVHAGAVEKEGAVLVQRPRARPGLPYRPYGTQSTFSATAKRPWHKMFQTLSSFQISIRSVARLILGLQLFLKKVL